MQEYPQETLGITFLDYNRKEYTSKALQSLGMYDVLRVDMKGISTAINYGLKYFFEDRNFKYVAICANDIELPPGALNKMLTVAQAIPETGISAIHCVEGLPDLKKVNGQDIHPCWGVFGNYLLTRKAFETIGYWNCDHDPYGMNDSDYCYRLDKAGFLNYYIYGLKANHLGNDVGSGTEYRQMKDAGLSKALNVFNRWKEIYDDGRLYLPYEQENYLIDKQQWVDQ